MFYANAVDTPVDPPFYNMYVQGVHPLWDPKEIGITQKVFRLGKKQRYHWKVEKWEFFLMVNMIPSGNSDTSQLRLKIGSLIRSSL